MVLLYMVCHGSHPYTPLMLAYIAAPWILWEWFIARVSILMAPDPWSLMAMNPSFQCLNPAFAYVNFLIFDWWKRLTFACENPIPIFFWLKLRFGCEIEFPRNSSFFRETKSTFQRPRSFSPLSLGARCGRGLTGSGHHRRQPQEHGRRAGQGDRSVTGPWIDGGSMGQWVSEAGGPFSEDLMSFWRKNSSHDMIFDIISFWMIGIYRDL